MKSLMLAIMPFAASEPADSAVFFFAKKQVVVADVCGEPCVGEGLKRSRCHRKKALYKATLFGSDPCLKDRRVRLPFPKLYTCPHRRKTNHVADSRAHIQCAIIDREALTVITVVRDCERS